MENKKIIFVAVAFIMVAAVIMGMAKINRLNGDLASMKLIADSSQKEMERLKEEKERISEEKEKLQVDTVSYMSSNSQLQEEKERMQKNLDEMKASIADKDSELQLAKARLEKAEKSSLKEGSVYDIGQAEEMTGLEKRVWVLEAELNKQKGTYYFNTGVMYAQQGKYDEAIDVYRRSLKCNAKDTDALYNLAVLYEEYDNSPEKALECYEKLLKLNPPAGDKEEIESAIKRLNLAVNE